VTEPGPGTNGETVMDKSESLELSEAFQPPRFERNILTVAKGGGITFAGKLFLSASRFVIAVLLARLLGAEQYGLYNLAISAGSVTAGLALLGLDSALVRYVALSASRRDEAGLWGALQIGLGITTFLSVMMGTGLFALAYPIAEQVFHEPRLAPLLQLISLIVPFLALSDVLAGATRGFKQMQYTVIAQSIAQPMIRLVLIVVLALVGLNAAWAVIVYGLADCAASFILLYFLNKQFSLRRPLRTARRQPRAILSFSLPVWLSGLMTTFRSNVQTLLVGTLNSVTGVGIFAVANQITLVGAQFHASINTSASPIIAELHDRGDREQMGRIYQTATRWALTVNFPVFLTMVLFPATILSIFGESFVGGATALTILAWANLANGGTGMGGIILDMTGYTRLKLVNSVIRLALYLSLDVLLIPRWGIVGAATAALVGEVIINLLRLLEVFILFRLLPYNRSFVKPIAAALTALASALVLGRWLPAEASPLYTAIHVLMIFAVYGGMTRLFGLPPEEHAMLAHLRRRATTILSRS